MATVPSFQIRSAPRMIPRIIHVIERWRETSRSISTAPMATPARSLRFSGFSRAAAASAGSGTSPLARELSDTGLDLIKGDITEPARCDDLLTIYHDVANGARRQRIHHVLFQRLDRPQRRVV